MPSNSLYSDLQITNSQLCNKKQTRRELNVVSSFYKCGGIMTKLNIDTTKIREAGTTMVTLSGEIDEIFNVIFDEINTISEKSGSWVGYSANQFIHNARIDKANYITFKNEVCEYGKFLKEYADSLEETINETRR